MGNDSSTISNEYGENFKSNTSCVGAINDPIYGEITIY